MKLGVIRRINKEELARSGDVPQWVDPLILTLNQFMDGVVTALSGRVSFSDNIQCKIITQVFTSGTEVAINPQSSIKPLGVIPITAVGKAIDSYKFAVKDNGNVGITLTYVGAGTAEATCIILF